MAKDMDQIDRENWDAMTNQARKRQLPKQAPGWLPRLIHDMEDDSPDTEATLP